MNKARKSLYLSSIIIALGIVLLNSLKINEIGIVIIAIGGYFFIRNIGRIKK